MLQGGAAGSQGRERGAGAGGHADIKETETLSRDQVQLLQERCGLREAPQGVSVELQG